MQPNSDNPRRRTLRRLTQGLFVVGLIAVAIPFFSSTDMGEDTAAVMDVDVSTMQAGEFRTLLWNGWPVFILKRTPAMLTLLRSPSDTLTDPWSKNSQQPEEAKNVYRSITPEYFVSYLGCSAQQCALEYHAQRQARQAYPHGRLECSCGNHNYDFAGRAYRDAHTVTNLPVPRYSFPEENLLRLGESG